MNPGSIWLQACRLVAGLPAPVVFDVGAHEGRVSRLFLDSLPDARVFAFEPQAARCEQLRTRFADEPRLRVANCALGEREGRTEFHEGVFDATSSRFPRNTSGRRYYRSDYGMRATAEVALDTLDAFCRREGVEQVDLLKLDTQGGEHDILLGAGALLADRRIGVILTEFFVVPHYEGAPLFDAIWALLANSGYTLFDLHCGPRASNGQLRYGDAIFVGPDFRREHLDSAPSEP